MGIFSKGWSSTFDERMIGNVQRNEIYWIDEFCLVELIEVKESINSLLHYFTGMILFQGDVSFLF